LVSAFGGRRTILPSIGIGNDEFARAGDAAWGAELGVFRQQVLDTVEDMQGDALCGGRIMFGNVHAQGDQVMDGFRRPLERFWHGNAT
jgi:hypothetical protein